MRQEKLTFATVTKPHLSRLKVLVPKVLPFVDRAVIVVGERDEESEQYLKSLGSKVELFYYRWHDNFAASWNAYLQQIEDGWVLILDDDEVPSDPMLESLGDYIEGSARGEKYCAVGFRANPISEGQDLGPSNYYRQVLFRRAPGQKYTSADPESGCHQCLVGYQNNRIIHCKDHEVYYHIKSLVDEYRNASRNYFIYGLWISDQQIERREEWHELRAIVKDLYPDIISFPELDAKLQDGVPNELTEWAVKWHHNLKEGSEYFDKNEGFEYWHYNEARAVVSYLFKYLHPEQKPEEIQF